MGPPSASDGLGLMEALAVEDRLVGARIVRVNTKDAGRVELYFEHRGTDDDAGVIIVPLAGIYFDAGFADDAPPQGSQ